MPPFYLTVPPLHFQDFRSSLLSLLWILFQVNSLFPLHLFGLVNFYHVPSSAAYFSVFSFCLIYCVWSLLFVGWKIIVPLTFEVCLQWVRLDQCLLKVFCWGRGTGACVLVGEVGSFVSKGQCYTSSSVFWDVCELGMALSRLSANR